MGGLYRGGQEEGRNGGEGGGKGGERGGGPQGRHLASRWCCREGALGGWFKVQGGVCGVVSLDFVVQKMLFRYDSRLCFRTRFPYRVFAPLLDTHAALNDAEKQLEICGSFAPTRTGAHGRADDSLSFRVGGHVVPQKSAILKQMRDTRVPAPVVPLLIGSSR